MYRTPAAPAAPALQRRPVCGRRNSITLPTPRRAEDRPVPQSAGARDGPRPYPALRLANWSKRCSCRRSSVRVQPWRQYQTDRIGLLLDRSRRAARRSAKLTGSILPAMPSRPLTPPSRRPAPCLASDCAAQTGIGFQVSDRWRGRRAAPSSLRRLARPLRRPCRRICCHWASKRNQPAAWDYWVARVPFDRVGNFLSTRPAAP